MFRDHYGLHADPFALSPNLKFLYMSKALEETMAHLAYGLEQGEDFILITGAIGTGKTLALHNLIAQVSNTFRTVLINVTQLTYRELLKLVASDLRLQLPEVADNADLLATLKAFLLQARERGRKLLLIIDEAQNLDTDTLEGVRMLTNLGQPGGQCLQIVLAGQPGLEKKILLPELVQLRQRIRIHYCLETLDRQEVENYISHRLSVAGCLKSLFKPRALDKIFRASGGVPRLVNILGSRALLAAYVDGSQYVEAEHVDVDESAPMSGETPEVAMEPPKPMPSPDQKAVASKETAPGSQSGEAAAATGPGAERPVDSESRGNGRRPYWVAAAVIFVIAVLFFTWPYLGGSEQNRFYPASQLADGTGETSDFMLTEDGKESTETSPENTTDPVPSNSAGSTNRQDGSIENPARTTPQQGGGGDSGSGTASTGTGPGADTEGRVSESNVDQRERNTASITPSVTTEDQANQQVNLSQQPAGGRPAAQPSERQTVSGRGIVSSAPPPSGFGIHVASFGQVARAESLIADLNRYGYPAFFIQKRVGSDIWHRVYVGPYTQREHAQRASRTLQSRGLTSYFFITKFGDG